MSFLVLLALFVLVPIVELWLLLRVAAAIGPGGGLVAVALVLFTGMAGAFLAKRQGLKVVRAVQQDLARARMPTDHLLSGLLVLAGGLLLLTPGILTDFVGLLLMVPGNRRLLIPPIKRYCTDRIGMRIYPLSGGEKEVDAREVGGAAAGGGAGKRV